MKPFFILLTGLLILHTIANSQSITMTVDGNLQGKFKSDNPEKDDKMIVSGITLEAGFGAAGVSSNRRQHQPLIVKKSAGAASPQFFQALISNELIRKAVIEFKGPNAYGEEAVTYTITLENVRVTNFKQTAEIPENGKPPRNLLIDEIKFVYQKITVESNTAHTMASDDTGTPVR